MKKTKFKSKSSWGKKTDQREKERENKIKRDEKETKCKKRPKEKMNSRLAGFDLLMNAKYLPFDIEYGKRENESERTRER